MLLHLAQERDDARFSPRFLGYGTRGPVMRPQSYDFTAEFNKAWRDIQVRLDLPKLDVGSINYEKDLRAAKDVYNGAIRECQSLVGNYEARRLALPPTKRGEIEKAIGQLNGLMRSLSQTRDDLGKR